MPNTARVRALRSARKCVWSGLRTKPRRLTNRSTPNRTERPAAKSPSSRRPRQPHFTETLSRRTWHFRKGQAAVAIDASQAPLVTVQWVKKSALSVGQECACDLVIKNAGKVAAKKLAVEAYFPATVRLTHSEPMPADNQDHVTWSIPTLGAGEERVVHVTLVPSQAGRIGDDDALVRFSTQASNVFVVEEPLLSLVDPRAPRIDGAAIRPRSRSRSAIPARGSPTT